LKKTLIIIGGPTASGKTQLAIELATRFNTVIVSADSRQFYRELSIGTAKPSPEELAAVQHYFINSHSITEQLNAGKYGIEAGNLITSLFNNHDIIIMAGGSGLFIDAVINGIDDLPEASPEVRNYLQTLFDTSGITALQNLLQEKDPEGYKKIDKKNPRRLIRAIEVCISAGKPYSELIGTVTNNRDWKIIMAGINLPRQVLYERINNRTDLMIEQGLKDEAASVMPFRNLHALKTVGYREMFEHLDGKITLAEAAELIARNTRNYAKRQMTWFRKYQDMLWIKPDETGLFIEDVESRIKSG